MITISITLNGKTRKVKFPTSWDDLTFSQYLELLTPKTDIELISMFTGVSHETIRKARIEGLEDLFLQLEFLQTPPAWDKHPKVFLGQTIPKDITFKSIGPYADCREIINKVPPDDLTSFVEAYAKYCAIYVQAISTKWEGYDGEEAMKLLPKVMQQPAGEVVGLGSFFITKLLPMKKPTETASRKKGTPRKKSKRVTKS